MTNNQPNQQWITSKLDFVGCVQFEVHSQNKHVHLIICPFWKVKFYNFLCIFDNGWTQVIYASKLTEFKSIFDCISFLTQGILCRITIFGCAIFDRLFFNHVYFKGNKHIHINFAKRQFNYIVWLEIVTAVWAYFFHFFFLNFLITKSAK